MNYVKGEIKIYCSGNNNITKVVTTNISNKSEFKFENQNNTTILINDLLETFSLPESVICWGRDFSLNNSSKYRMVQLFNQSCWVISSVYLPVSVETLVAKIIMLY